MKIFNNISNKRSSIYYFVIILIFLFIVLFKYYVSSNIIEIDKNLNYSNIEELFDIQKCDLKFNELGKEITDRSLITYVEIPVFPEIENLKCIGSIAENFSLNDLDNIKIYTNKKLFKFMLFSFSFLLMFLSLQTIKKNYFLFSILIILLISAINWIFFVELSINELLAQSLTTFIFYFLVAEFISIYKSGEPSLESDKIKEKLIIIFVLISLFSIIFLEYIFFDYFIILTLVGLLVTYFASNVIEINRIDKMLIILISHFAIFINGVDLPLSRNHFNYLPNILSETSNILSLDYQSNISFPYPAFKALTSLFINLFGINVLNFLNYLTYYLIILSIVFFIYFLSKKLFILVSLTYILLTSQVFLETVFTRILSFNNYKFLYIYSSNGLADSTLITKLYEPTGFDILILPAILLISKKKVFAGFVVLSIAVLMHTYNIVPALILLAALILKNKGISKKNLFEFSPLLGTVIFFISYYLLKFNVSPEQIIEADRILTDFRIPGHRQFGHNLSLFLYTPFPIILDISNILKSVNFEFRELYFNGFSFHIELIIFTIFIFKKSKNNLIKNTVGLIFLSTIVSITISIFNNSNSFGALLRSVTPWKTSALIYMIAVIYFLIYIFNKSDNVKLLIFFLIFASTQIYFQNLTIDNNYIQKETPTLNQNLLRRDLVSESKAFDPYKENVNLTMRYDDGIIFKYFYPTTGNFFGHPYEPDEIIQWKEDQDTIEDFYYSEPSCSEGSDLLKKYNLKYMLFSDKRFIPDTLEECKNLRYEKDKDIYIFER